MKLVSPQQNIGGTSIKINEGGGRSAKVFETRHGLESNQSLHFLAPRRAMRGKNHVVGL